MKAFIKIVRFLKDIYPDIYPESCPRACNFFPTLPQMEERCWSKLISESIVIPSKVLVVLVVSTSTIDILTGVMVLRERSNQGWL